MKFELVYSYPLWFIPCCLLVGALYAWVLYRKKHGFPEVSMRLIGMMSALRFLVVSFLCFLLFAPLLRINSRELEKPVILFLQDNSESITQVSDSLFYKTNYPKQVEQLQKDLEAEYDFKSYSFDDQLIDSLPLNFKGKETDISNALKSIYDLYENRNVGAIILSSDGIFNKGSNPLYLNRVIQAPIYTVALGDTVTRRDLVLRDLRHNQLAFLNNTFPVNIVIQAQKLAGKESVLSIEHNGQVIVQEPFYVKESAELKTFDFQIKADQVGVQRYTVKIKGLNEEFTLANNTKDFFIEVADRRQKVLVLASSAHPDVAAIRSSLESNKNYEVTVQLADKFTGSLKEYSLVILHQLPSITNTIASVQAQLNAEGIPTWTIIGSATLPGALNSQQRLIQLNGSRGGMNDVYPLLNSSFALFTLSDELRTAISIWGPLQLPIGSYVMQSSAVSLIHQKIGSVPTQFPLFVFSSDQESKSALLAGEGIWRWRMQNFAETGSHDLFDELITKTVQYLSIRNERKNLRVITKKSFNENERIRFDAEVYNASYESINTPDVAIEITDSKGNRYPYSFSRSTSAYTLDAGIFRAGEYAFSAKTVIGGKEYKDGGQFLVKPVTIERTNGRADHILLSTLSGRTGGELIQAKDLNSLAEKIKARSDVKPVSHMESRLQDLIQFPWIFALILVLLCTEWFLRKYLGSY